MSVVADADAYYADTTVLYRQAIAMVLKLWATVDVGDISASWIRLLPQALAIMVAADTVAAEMADPYLSDVLDNTSGGRISSDGMVRSGLGDMLYSPATRAKASIGQGLAANVAMQAAGRTLATYVHTRIADTGRLAVTTGMVARPHCAGYYRMLRPPSCARCAILAGKWFHWNKGFKRHPRCDCIHIPAAEAGPDLALNPRDAIEAGEVTGLSKAETRAILEYGANPSQVVHARQGMYDVGEFRATTAGTTRQGVAGARILAQGVDRALGVDVTSKTYTNVTFDRAQAAKYAELFRRGKTYTRDAPSGVQSYAYRFARTPRPTPAQIVASVDSRAEAIRLLTNYGYIL